jgi:GTPase SAR1 family protein
VSADAVDAEITHASGVILAARQGDIAVALARDDSTFRSQAEASVVVVGEVKRGKSALINALVGTPGLCPVDSDVATNTYLVVRNGAPRALVSIGKSQERREIELTEVAKYATTTGNPDNELGVQRVEVWTPAPALAGLSIVDTPGVGGLESPHRRLVLDALEVASGLIFVLDATAPIGRPEIDFLRQASDRVETIVVVVTKTDTVLGWRHVVAANRVALASQGPRFERCPVLGVSSRLVNTAFELEQEGHHDDALELRAESGIDDLLGALRTVADQDGTAICVTRLRRTRTALEAAVSGVGELVVVAQATPALAEQISEAERRLDELGQDSATWVQQLTSQMATQRVRAIAQLESACREAATRVGDAIVRGGSSVATVELLQTEAEVLNRQTMDDLAERLLEIGRKILGDSLETTSLLAVVEEVSRLPLPSPVMKRSKPARRGSRVDVAVEDAVTTFQGDSIAHTVVEGLRLVAANAVAFAGPGALIGVVWAAGLHIVKKKHANTAEARQWANDTLAAVQRTIQADLELSIINGQDQLASAVRNAIAARSRDLKKDRAALDRARNGDDASRAAAVAELREREKELTAAIGRVDGLLAELSRPLQIAPAESRL